MNRLAFALMMLPMIAACSGDNRIDRVPRAPNIEILSPVADELFRLGEGAIPLIGTASDAVDSPDDLDATWQLDDGDEWGDTVSDQDRIEDQLETDGLELGFHEITLRVTDRDDATALAIVRFELQGPLGSPEVTITSPDDGASFETDAQVTFTGEATDATTAPDDLVFEWSSSEDGVLDGALSTGGESVLVTDGLSAGPHTITLRVTDDDDEVGVDQINITLADPDVLAQPGDLVFSEMMINPQVVEDEVGEWGELYNTASYPIDIGGYQFHDDDVDHQILEGSIVVAGNDYVVLCAQMNPSVNGGVQCDGQFERLAGEGGLALANNPDEVVLSRPDGTEIDWLHYTDDWFDPGIAIGVDPGFLNGGDNDQPSHWCNQTTIVASGGEPGTPGMVNDDCP